MHPFLLGVLGTIAVAILILSVLIYNKVNSRCKSENYSKNMKTNAGPPYSTMVTKVTGDMIALDDGSSFVYGNGSMPFCNLRNVKVGDVFSITENCPSSTCPVLTSYGGFGFLLVLTCPNSPTGQIINVQGSFPAGLWLLNNPTKTLYYTYTPMSGQPNVPICSC